MNQLKNLLFPVFTLKRNGKRVAVNPNHVTAIYEDEEGKTDIFTLDCAREDDAWDVEQDFDTVRDQLAKCLETI